VSIDNSEGQLTYAAATANISELFAVVQILTASANSTVKPIKVYILLRGSLIKYRPSIETAGNKAARSEMTNALVFPAVLAQLWMRSPLSFIAASSLPCVEF
jgi:hypothetical protein